MIDWQRVAADMNKPAAEKIADRVMAAMREKEDVRLAQISNRARYAFSSLALARSAGREFWSAVEQHGDAAARGDLDAVERIHEAGKFADAITASLSRSPVKGSLGTIR